MLEHYTVENSHSAEQLFNHAAPDGVQQKDNN